MAIYILAWFAVVIPLLGAGGSFFAETPRRAGQLCRLFTAVSFALTLIVLGARLRTAAQAPFDSFITLFTMSPPETTIFASRFAPQLGVHVDSITAVFAALSSFVVLSVQSYASVALRGDPGYRRFFWAASLLLFAVLGLAYSPNLLQFWAMSGIASLAVYILMLHWWERPDAGTHARRVFLALYSADLALLLTVAFVFVKFGLFAAQQPAQTGSDIFDPFSFAGIATLVNGAQRGLIAGVGLRTLEVTSILMLFVALVRSAQIPFHAWFAEAVHAPVAVTALATSTAGITGAYLLVREYPLLLSSPHVLAAVAVLGAATAALCALLALSQRDLYRAGALVSASLLGLSFAALGAGGFAAGLYTVAAASLLSALFFMAAGNVARSYRTRDLDELGGAWRRMRTTSVALGAWGVAAAGLSLALYYALSAALDNSFPNGGHLGGLARALTAALLIAGGIAISAAALGLVLKVCTGEAARRRGFQPEKVADIRDAALRWTVAGLAAAVLLVAFAIPALGLSWTQFLVLAAVPGVHTDFNGVGFALALAAALLGGAFAATWSRVLRREGAPLGFPQPEWMRVLARDLLLERALPLIGRPFAAAGALVTRFDERVDETLADSLADGVQLVAERASHARRSRSNMYLAGAAGFVGVLVVLSLLAATGHLGGVTL